MCKHKVAQKGKMLVVGERRRKQVGEIDKKKTQGRTGRVHTCICGRLWMTLCVPPETEETETWQKCMQCL